LGEFDALPGISQKTVPEKTPFKEGAAGHGCGHNMYGTASLGAAVAIKNLIAEGKLKGTGEVFWNPCRGEVFWKTMDGKSWAF
jgi:aminobenzoyl-glutamate utilization protein B